MYLGRNTATYGEHMDLEKNTGKPNSSNGAVRRHFGKYETSNDK
jgi:hypothetical protein